MITIGTNFYLLTQKREIADNYFGYNRELTDTPVWGYEIHIAKTSSGWLPLFQAHDCFKSVKQLKALYDTGDFLIYDEYSKTYTWEEFDQRVLQFNGGTVKNRPPNSSKTVVDGREVTIPISHPEYSHLTNYYFADEDGYEFCYGEFS